MSNQYWSNPRFEPWKPYELVLAQPVPDKITDAMLVATAMQSTNAIINAMVTSKRLS